MIQMMNLINVEAKHAYNQVEWRIYDGSAAIIAKYGFIWSVLELQARMQERRYGYVQTASLTNINKVLDSN